MEAKVIEMKRESDSKIDKLEAKIDRVLISQQDTKDQLAAAEGAKDYKQWLFPTLFAAALAVITLLQLFKH